MTLANSRKPYGQRGARGAEYQPYLLRQYRYEDFNYYHRWYCVLQSYGINWGPGTDRKRPGQSDDRYHGGAGPSYGGYLP